MKTWKTIAIAATVIVVVGLVTASAAAYVGQNASNVPLGTGYNGATYPNGGYGGIMGCGPCNQYPQNYGRCNGTAIYPYQNPENAFRTGCCGCR